MFKRTATLPDRSFLLFGPRGTGKTTWLREVLPSATWFDLLHEREQSRLLRAPRLLFEQVAALPDGSWIVVDEVQRVPAVLDEVQDLLARFPGKYRFAITGSSARKLRRSGGNLLPGRLINRRFFPLTVSELGTAPLDPDALLLHGGLPAVRSEPSAALRDDLLEAYVDNYLTQEIRLEAAAKNLGAFARFLEVAALANGQVTNVSGLSRDAEVARPTVQGYFEVLVDTLVGYWLPAWCPRAKVKETAHPKFYFFDTGVVRALAARSRSPLEAAERGPLLETWILHELRAWIDRSGCGGTLAYWRTAHGTEVDFVWSRGKNLVAIEVKAAGRWRPEFVDGIESLAAQLPVTRAFVAYLGSTPLRVGSVDALPLADFLGRLYGGSVLS
ncbi:MAG: ATP-binding protein [Candidatus Sericytochromatia bacterium]|nr:ATP-binding protein [Candidatus Tanganyikabacteria bacterium]